MAMVEVNLFSSFDHHIEMHLTLLASQVGLEGHSLLFIDEELRNHCKSKSQSKQVEEVTCIFWILSKFQLVVLQAECTSFIVQPSKQKNLVEKVPISDNSKGEKE